MGILKHIILSACFIFALHMNTSAQNGPLAVLKNSSDKAILASNKNQKLLQISTNSSSLKFRPFLNTKSVKQSTMVHVLGWDMKFKFRLSHNLNIIFSYN